MGQCYTYYNFITFYNCSELFEAVYTLGVIFMDIVSVYKYIKMQLFPIYIFYIVRNLAFLKTSFNSLNVNYH